MNKLSKICSLLICIMLLFAIAIGVMTRLSYKTFDYSKAVLNQQNVEVNTEVISRLSIKKVQRKLNKTDVVFVVIAKEKEQSYKSIRTLVDVQKVIKGNEELVGQTVSIYETSFIDYQKQTGNLSFRSMNNLSIGMQPGRRYLVFADKVEYAQEYKETLPYDEFIVDWDYYMYYFPIDSQIKPIEPKDNLTYGDIKNFDYICFNEKDADKLERIKNSVLDEYLNEE